MGFGGGGGGVSWVGLPPPGMCFREAGKIGAGSGSDCTHDTVLLDSIDEGSNFGRGRRHSVGRRCADES